MQQNAALAWERIWQLHYCPKTGLIYDRPGHGDLPSPEEIALQLPNPCGWNTGMEDSMISAGIMLDALLCRYAVTGAQDTAEYAQKLLQGIRLCTRVSGVRGFLARSVLPHDGKSFYCNSSRDQYTHAVFSLHAFLRSPLCSPLDAEWITDALVAFAQRAETNVRAANGFSYLRADGRIGLVDAMWGESLSAHEWLRLPMIYLAAWDASGDGHWFELYRGLRDEAIARSLEFDNTRVVRTFIYYQMQLSAWLLRHLEPDREYREKYTALMQYVADTSRGVLPAIADWTECENVRFDCAAGSWRTLPTQYLEGAPIGGYAYHVPIYSEQYLQQMWQLNTAACAVLVQTLCPGRTVSDADRDAFYRIFDAVDVSNHDTRMLPYCVGAHWALQASKL